MKTKNFLLLGTRKGLIVYQKNANGWQYKNVHFIGIPVTLAYIDPRNNSWWAFQDHGHWGVKMHRSINHGKTWDELPAPAYPKGSKLKDGESATLKYIWAFAHGGIDRPNDYWMGTIPGGLFKSTDGGNTFKLNKALWDEPTRIEQWFGGGFDQPGIHSIVVNPKNSDHVYIGISCAGVYETKDGGESWKIRSKGLRADFLPDPKSEVGQDPHMLVACPSNPKVMWQQNHCGVFVSKNGGRNWRDVSEKKGLANFGFAMAVDEKKPDRTISSNRGNTWSVMMTASLSCSYGDAWTKRTTDSMFFEPAGVKMGLARFVTSS